MHILLQMQARSQFVINVFELAIFFRLIRTRRNNISKPNLVFSILHEHFIVASCRILIPFEFVIMLDRSLAEINEVIIIPKHNYLYIKILWL